MVRRAIVVVFAIISQPLLKFCANLKCVHGSQKKETQRHERRVKEKTLEGFLTLHTLGEKVIRYFFNAYSLNWSSLLIKSAGNIYY